jgi:hypothetical protein
MLFLVALTATLDYTLTTADLAERITGTSIVEQLDLLGEVNAKTAARLLEDARDLSGESRQLKLVLALSHLEAAYTVYAHRAEIPRRRSLRAFYSRLDAFQTASQLAFLCAITYKAVGADAISVRACLRDANAWFGRREDLIRSRLERDRRAETFFAARHYASPAPFLAKNDARLRALAAERRTAAAVADKVASIKVEPAEAFTQPWFMLRHI